MVRIAGVDIPDNKKVAISLSRIRGIGPVLARNVLSSAKVDESKRAKELTVGEIAKLREIIEKNYQVEGELRREVMFNIKRLRDIGSYRGTRHQRGLPVRGQRTKTNSRTRRGNVRRTMTSGKRKADKK